MCQPLPLETFGRSRHQGIVLSLPLQTGGVFLFGSSASLRTSFTQHLPLQRVSAPRAVLGSVMPRLRRSVVNGVGGFVGRLNSRGDNPTSTPGVSPGVFFFSRRGGAERKPAKASARRVCARAAL
jgi:hypothetical protein